MGPLNYYLTQCENQLIVKDEQQLIVLQHLQKVYEDLIKEQQKRRSVLSVLRKPRLVKGLYVWGSVGIGKTFLMDCFYQSLPFEEKQRMHFHRFMQTVHQALRKHQGKKNPLDIIAQEIADKTLVLCFDELVVTDIADAMILARLFKALFLHGVCLVATSNTMPDNLYQKGVLREQFLPAIALIKRHLWIHHVPTLHDYRTQVSQAAGVFFTPNDADAHAKMEVLFTELTQGLTVDSQALYIHERMIPIRKKAGKVVWFDFNIIANVPRSQQDFLEIVRKFNTVFISDITAISGNARNIINLFIRLIDVLYDANVRLVFSASQPIEKIYIQGPFLQEFARTRSRLIEMQTMKYFSSK